MGRIETRFSLRRLLLLAAIAVVSAFVLAVGSRPGGANAAPNSGPSTGILRICSGCADHGLDSPGRYSYVVLNSWQAGLIPQLKQANPSVKVLVYKDVAATVSYACHGGVDDDRLSAGVGYCWANANHPDWFLNDTTGARIEFCDFHGAWQMDVGSPTYQQQWVSNVLADLHSAPWDGVVLDDVNQSETWHLCGRTIARYPTGAQYSAATESFLAAVGPALRGAGYLAMPNIALDDWWTADGVARWDRWVSYSSGAVQEYYTKWGRDSSRWLTDDGVHNDWSGREGLFARTEAAGKTFIGVTYAPGNDARSMSYARASFLLDWDGGPSALVFEPTNPEAQDPYAAQWNLDLGRPKGARRQVGVAWKRTYSDGVVVLNPSPSVSQTVSLGGRYELANGEVVSTVTVGPTDALLLRPSGNGRSAPPANTARPRVSGARASRMLGASAGSWKNASAFSFQWLRCNRHGKHCKAVSGASSRRYVLAAADVGKRLRIVVTAVNSAGSAARASAATKAINRTRLLRHARHRASVRARLTHSRS